MLCSLIANGSTVKFRDKTESMFFSEPAGYRRKANYLRPLPSREPRDHSYFTGPTPCSSRSTVSRYNEANLRRTGAFTNTADQMYCCCEDDNNDELMMTMKLTRIVCVSVA